VHTFNLFYYIIKQHKYSIIILFLLLTSSREWTEQDDTFLREVVNQYSENLDPTIPFQWAVVLDLLNSKNPHFQRSSGQYLY